MGLRYLGSHSPCQVPAQEDTATRTGVLYDQHTAHHPHTLPARPLAEAGKRECRYLGNHSLCQVPLQRSIATRTGVLCDQRTVDRRRRLSARRVSIVAPAESGQQ